MAADSEAMQSLRRYFECEVSFVFIKFSNCVHGFYCRATLCTGRATPDNAADMGSHHPHIQWVTYKNRCGTSAPLLNSFALKAELSTECRSAVIWLPGRKPLWRRAFVGSRFPCSTKSPGRRFSGRVEEKISLGAGPLPRHTALPFEPSMN